MHLSAHHHPLTLYTYTHTTLSRAPQEVVWVQARVVVVANDDEDDGGRRRRRCQEVPGDSLEVDEGGGWSGGWDGAGCFGSALRRSSLDEEVVCGGQAWPAYQIRGVFWSCSRYGVLAFQGSDLPTSLSLSLRFSLGPHPLVVAALAASLSGFRISLVRKLPLGRRSGGVLIGLRGDTH